MTSEDRRLFLRNSLDRELAALPTSSQRITWLGDHLAEYAARAVGFAEVDGLSLSALVESDAFCVLDLASALLREAIATSDRERDGGVFRTYVEQLSRAQGSPSIESIRELHRRAVALADALRSSAL